MIRAFVVALAATVSVAARAENPKSLNVKLVCDGTELEIRLRSSIAEHVQPIRNLAVQISNGVLSTTVDGKVVNIPIKHIDSDRVTFSNPPGEPPKFGRIERQVGHMEVTIAEHGTPYAAKLSLNCQNFLPKVF